MHTVLERGRDAHRKPCVRISTVFRHCLTRKSTQDSAFLLRVYCSPCASLLYSSIVCVHSYYVQAFSCMHFYFPLCAFMPYSGTDPRGKLSKSSTLWVHFSCVSCISITFPLHFYYISITFPLHFFSSTSCISFPAILFHCISFPALLASSYIAS